MPAFAKAVRLSAVASVLLAALLAMSVISARADAWDDVLSAEAALNRGQSADAVKALTGAINSQKLEGIRLAVAMQIRGSAYRARNQIPAARADFTRTIELIDRLLKSANLSSVDREWAHRVRGNANVQLMRDTEALADYGAAINALPDQPFAYKDRGHVYLLHRRYDLAIADFESALKIKPDDPSTYYQRGTAHALQGDVPQALADFDRAIAMAPPGRWIWHLYRAHTYFIAGNYAQAIIAYERASALNPESSKKHLERARRELQLGSKSKYATDKALWESLLGRLTVQPDRR